MHQLLPGIALHISKTLFTLLLLLSGVSVHAQYPVQVSPQIISPYSLKLSDYSSGTSPRIIVTVTNNDFQQPLINVRLRMNITGQGITLRSKDNVFYPIISLTAGVPRSLTLQDMAPYFDLGNLDFQGMTLDKYQRSGRLPDGFYTFCFEAIEINSNQVVSRAGCTMISISLSEPPMLNSPFNNAMINEMEPVNILFSWTPKHLSSPNAAFNTVYDFQLVELLDNGVSPEVAFRSNAPLYQTTTNLTTLNYNAFNPLLFPGKKYGWRVRARSLDATLESDIFKNNGYSEIFFFTYNNEVCDAPSNITVVNPDPVWNQNKYTWSSVPNSILYTFQYRSIDDTLTPWKTITTKEPYLRSLNVNRGTYQFRVGNTCKEGRNPSFSKIQTFTHHYGQLNSKPFEGRVLWGFSATTVTPNPADITLVSVTKKPESIVKYNDYRGSIGKIRYPLKLAIVEIQQKPERSSERDRTFREVTDAEGYFRFDDKKNRPTNSKLQSEIRQRYFLPRQPLTDVNGFKSDTFYLFPKTFEFQPSVFIPNYKTGEVSLDILMKKSIYDQSYAFHFQQAFPVVDRVVKYNNEDYVPIVKLKDGKVYNKLFINLNEGENYIARVTVKTVSGQNIRYYPLPLINAPGLYKKTFEYKLRQGIEGIISAKNQPRRDVKLMFRIKPEDILSNDTATTFTAVTDAKGNYSNYDLPLLKLGAEVKISVSDQSLSSVPFEESVMVSSADTIKKNISLINQAYTIIGKVLSEKGTPISNALVTVEGTSAQSRTSSDGLYAIKITGNSPVTLKIASDNYQSTSVYLRPNPTWNQSSASQTKAQWKAAIEAKQTIKEVMQQKNVKEANAELLNIGTGSLLSRFDTYFTGVEDVKGVYENEVVRLTAIPGSLSVQVNLKGSPVNAILNIEGFINQKISAASPSKFLVNPGKVFFSVSPVAGELPFVAVMAEATILPNNVTAITVSVNEGKVLKGVITEKGTGNKISSAKVAVIGFPFETTSNSKGEYSFIVPNEKELRIEVSKQAYNITTSTIQPSTDKLNGDFKLETRPVNIADIKTLSNFPIQLDKIERVSDSTYSISGKLTIKANDIFNPGKDSILTFKNAKVTATYGYTNATPAGEIKFEEAVLQTSAFGFGIVEITGAPQIIMKGLPGENGQVTYNKTVIGGALKIKLSTIPAKVKNFPLILSDASVISTDEGVVAENKQIQKDWKSAFAYVYSSPDNKMTSLRSSQKFSILFSGPLKDSIKVNLGELADLLFSKTGELSSDGIKFTGKLKLKPMPHVMFSSDAVLEKFSIANDYSIKLNVSDTFVAKLQKIEARISKVNLNGLGTANFNIGFNGTIRYKKGSGMDEELIINDMNIAKVEGSPTLSGVLSFNSYFNFKSLYLWAVDKSTMTLSYKKADSTYSIQGGGKMSIGNNIFKNKWDGFYMLPIEALINVKTKDMSIALTQSSNVSMLYPELGYINIKNIQLFLGSNSLSPDAINQYLTSGKTQALNQKSAPPYELLDETQAYWALALKGKFHFIQSNLAAEVMDSRDSVNVLLANLNNKLESRYSPFEVSMKTRLIELKSKVQFQINEQRDGFGLQGLPGAATLSSSLFETLKGGDMSYFKFFEDPQGADWERKATFKINDAERGDVIFNIHKKALYGEEVKPKEPVQGKDYVDKTVIYQGAPLTIREYTESYLSLQRQEKIMNFYKVVVPNPLKYNKAEKKFSVEW